MTKPKSTQSKKKPAQKKTKAPKPKKPTIDEIIGSDNGPSPVPAEASVAGGPLEVTGTFSHETVISASTEIDLSDQNLDAGRSDGDGDGEDMGFSDEELSAAADAGVEDALDESVLEALDGSGAELGDLADDLKLSEAEVRGAVRRLEAAGKVVVEKDLEGGGTYVNLPGEGDEKKVHAVKANGSNGAATFGSATKAITDAAKKIADAMSPEDDDRPTRNLKCILTESEKAEKARLVAENFKAVEDLEAERERLAEDLKSVKGKIDGLNLDNRRAMRANREGYEYRDVVCEERTNFIKATMDTVRIDTLEIIETRALTKAERQGDLFSGAST